MHQAISLPDTTLPHNLPILAAATKHCIYFYSLSSSQMGCKPILLGPFQFLDSFKEGVSQLTIRNFLKGQRPNSPVIPKWGRI